MGNTILLTGHPGCGKTTLILYILERLSIPAGGFYTQELREDGKRKGFELITMDGKREILAHIDLHSTSRVGKYGVNLSALNDLAVVSIHDSMASGKLIVIDEIGPMENTSPLFRNTVIEALESSMTVLGTIVQRSTPFTDQIKRLPQVSTFTVDTHNPKALVEEILKKLL